MKTAGAALVWALAALFALPAPAAAQEDRTITKVVKLLQSMLEKSKADGDADRELFAKFKCYCDTKTAQKNKEIDELTKQIGVLSSNIQDLLGSTGGLSTECAELKKALAANEQSRNEAEALRAKEHASFEATEADLTNAIAQMDNALNVLSEVGADQTLAEAADHSKFMAGYKSGALLKLRSTVHQALTAASAFLGAPHRQRVQSFLQAPFTGNYAAQSGEVVGILKNMRDTFKSNLEAAVTAENAEQAAYDKFMATKLAERDEMQQLYNEKQDQLGSNDGALASKRKQLSDSEEQKAIRQEFLSQLVPTCARKAEEYKERMMLRGNEDAAISEAVAILNSDAAFATFGTVAAATTGPVSLLQRVAVHRHAPSSADISSEASRILRAAGSAQKSLRLLKVAALLEAENPFTVVLQQIEKIVSLIDQEGEVDKKKLDWCNAEREASDRTVEEKAAQITALIDEITGLTNDIEAPETGLKAQISATDAALEENAADQKVATEQRAAENALFQQNVRDLASAEDLLSSAVAVLSKYYEQLSAHAKPVEEAAVLAGETEAHPETWEHEGGYQGQSSNGNKAIEMLDFILEETKKEEAAARKDEDDAQALFDETMAALKAGEAHMQASMAVLRKTLAEKEGELLEKKSSLKNTESEKAAVEAYLVDIKPGCDFITANFELRESHRAAERSALVSAQELIQGTPVFKSAVAAAHIESLGECKDPCVAAPEQVECKACLSKVTIPAYCAGHPGTPGC